MATTLVVLAAGLGTRFGGLKQLAPVGPNDEAIVDFLLRRAAAAGFDQAIVVVRPDIGELVDDHLDAMGRPLPVELVVQPDRRGTAHAVLVARDALDGNRFAVVNADDLYPASAFTALNAHLDTRSEHAMVAFRVDRTFVSEQPVTRAAIRVDDRDRLVSITERTVVPAGAGQEWVSMNMWGFDPRALDDMAAAMIRQPEGEVLLPHVVAAMLAASETVRVLWCDEPCIGITHAGDVDVVRQRLR